MKEQDRIYIEAREWCFNLRRTSSPVEAEKAIRKRLEKSSNEIEARALKTELALLLEGQHRLEEAQLLLEQVIISESYSAMSLMGLVSHFLYVRNMPLKAFETIVLAENAARKSGHFLRHVLATKARIALALDRYDIHEQCLREIPTIAMVSGARDVGCERDFFDRADKSRIDPAVVLDFADYSKNLER